MVCEGMNIASETSVFVGSLVVCVFFS